MKNILLIILILLSFTVYAQPGSLDATFGIGGKVNNAIGNSFCKGNAVALQKDGKIIVAGASVNNFALVRYNSDGTFDTTFGFNGIVSTDFESGIDEAFSIAIQGDGKIVVAGNTSKHGYDFATAKYNNDGTLDSTFGSGGKVVTDFGNSQDLAYSVIVQSDDKILVAGSSLSSSNYIQWSSALVRYNSNGSLDNTFGTNGKVTSSFLNNSDGGSATIQADGKILIVGMVYSNATMRDFAMIRYNSDGTLDGTFGNNGFVITDFAGYSETANSVTIQSDGKVVLAGWTTNSNNSYYALARYQSNGNLDTKFGTGGKVTTDFGSYSQGNSVAIQSDGKILLAGISNNGTDKDFAIVRYNNVGTLDSIFGSDGIVTTDFGGYDDFGISLAIQGDGKIVVAGYSQNSSVANFALARYNNNPLTGIVEHALNKDIEVVLYPNPSSGIYNVSLNNKTIDTKIHVYDVFGNCLWRKDCRNDVSLKIDLSSQPKGIYFMEVVSDRERVMKRIVLQ